MKYKVTFEARARNAHGIFSPEIVFVESKGRESALFDAMNKLHEKGFETRFPLECELMGE